MSLTFNPALGVNRTIPVPRDRKVKLRFAATFASRYAYESARANGTRVEMWTNLASSSGSWQALPFEFAEDKAKPEQATKGALLSLISSTLESHDQAETSVYLDLELSDVRVGSKFSFTYRLIRPWGEVQWLGSFGKNGDLVFEEDDVRFALEDGWKSEERVSIISNESKIEEGIVAKLSKEFEWSSWAFEKDGWPVFSSSAVAPLSSAILLIPTTPKGSSSLVMPQPLAITTTQGSIAVSTTGHILAQHAQALTIRTVQSSANLQDILPENLHLVDIGTGAGFASVVSKPTAEANSAVTLSIIPVQPDKTAPVSSVALDDSVFPLTSKSDAVLVNVSSISGNPDILLLEEGEKKDVTVRFGSAGGQVLYTPLHALAVPEDESSWKLALLNPYTSAFVELIQEEDDTLLTLPTPPPSPPPMRLSPVSPAMRASPQISIPIPAPQSFEEVTPKEVAVAEVQPLTPSSPPPRDSFGFQTAEPVETAENAETVETSSQEEKPEGEESSIVELKEEASDGEVSKKPASLTLVPKQPVRGFIRLVLFWIFRALFERVCGILTTGARWWGLPRLFTGGHSAMRLDQEHSSDKGKQKAIEGKEETVDEEVPPPIAEEKTEEEIEEKVEEATPVDPEPDPVEEENLVTEDETLIQDDERSIAASEPVEVEKPLTITVPSPKFIFETETPTTVIVHKRAPPKPRFLADVRSNLVSLLVHAPHSLAKPDDLNVTIDGKRVLDSHAGYRCTQLSGDFYLLGLQGPSGGSKLEVTVD